MPPGEAKQTTRISPISLVEQAVELLHQRIVDGVLPAGSRLVIDQLAREFGISLVPIREALARLHAEKLVEHSPNRGYRVAQRLSSVDIRKLFEAREVLEAGTIDLVVRNVDDALIKALRRMNKAISSCKTGQTFAQFQEFVELNDEFHAAILAAGGNTMLLDAYKGLSYGPLVARELFGRGVPDLKNIVQEHEAIISNLERRDRRGAKRAIRDHIADGFRRFESDH